MITETDGSDASINQEILRIDDHYQEVGGRQEQVLLQSPQKENLDFQPLVLWENEFLVLNLWHFVVAILGH